MKKIYKIIYINLKLIIFITNKNALTIVPVNMAMNIIFNNHIIQVHNKVACNQHATIQPISDHGSNSSSDGGAQQHDN